MSDSAYAAREGEVEDYGDDGFGDAAPGRLRRRLLNRWSVASIAAAVTAIGFYVGVRVEKGQLASTGTSAVASTASRDGATGSSTSKSSTRTGSSVSKTAGGLATSSSGSASTGTVVRVDGDTLYVKDSDGNTVKVKISGVTTIDKSETVGKGEVNPGDSVVIAGTTGSSGDVSATSITDSGSSDTSSSTTSSSTS